jgi:hypothetical protein
MATPRHYANSNPMFFYAPVRLNVVLKGMRRRAEIELLELLELLE